jgi:hypothetical protein
VIEVHGKSASCRLCSGEAAKKFELLVLDRYQVSYFVCTQCGSLQADFPFWLKDAYEFSLSHLDAGAAQRCLSNAAAVIVMSIFTGCRNVVDFGGGDGLLCRLLRDYGLNCFVHDKFATATYAQRFTQPNFQQPDLLIAFEVIEHFAEPCAELAELFATNAEILMVSTELYSQQQGNWWYLTPSSGQHVFFYSRQALLQVSKRFGYDVRFFGRYVTFYRPKRIPSFVVGLLGLICGRVFLRLARAILLAGPAPGVSRDFELLTQTREAEVDKL